MSSKERSSPRHWHVEDILGHLNDNVDNNNAEELIHCILTSTDILTWNLQGEIVYKGQNIRGTNIVDLLQYTVLRYNTEIPEPTGLNIFLKGLANWKLEIGKNVRESVNTHGGKVVKDFAEQGARTLLRQTGHGRKRRRNQRSNLSSVKKQKLEAPRLTNWITDDESSHDDESSYDDESYS